MKKLWTFYLTFALGFLLGVSLMTAAIWYGVPSKAQTQYNDVRMAGTTGSIGGGALLLGACASGTVAIPSAIVGQNVIVNGSDCVSLAEWFLRSRALKH